MGNLDARFGLYLWFVWVLDYGYEVRNFLLSIRFRLRSMESVDGKIWVELDSLIWLSVDLGIGWFFMRDLSKSFTPCFVSIVEGDPGFTRVICGRLAGNLISMSIWGFSTDSTAEIRVARFGKSRLYPNTHYKDSRSPLGDVLFLGSLISVFSSSTFVLFTRFRVRKAWFVSDMFFGFPSRLSFVVYVFLQHLRNDFRRLCCDLSHRKSFYSGKSFHWVRVYSYFYGWSFHLSALFSQAACWNLWFCVSHLLLF